MADLRITYDEEMVGAGHPTKEDTLNRLVLAEHNSDGTHKNALKGALLGLGCSRASAGSLSLAPGWAEINGSLYGCAAALTKSGLTGLAADTWHYLLAAAPASGQELSAAELSISSTAPAFDGGKNGWYSGSSRCIGAFLTDGSGGIIDFVFTAGQFVFTDPVIFHDATGSQPTSLTLISAGAPALGRMLVNVNMYAARSGGNVSAQFTNGDQSVDLTLAQVLAYGIINTGGASDAARGWAMTNANGECKYSTNDASNTVKLYLLGFRAGL